MKYDEVTGTFPAHAPNIRMTWMPRGNCVRWFKKPPYCLICYVRIRGAKCARDEQRKQQPVMYEGLANVQSLVHRWTRKDRNDGRERTPHICAVTRDRDPPATCKATKVHDTEKTYKFIAIYKNKSTKILLVILLHIRNLTEEFNNTERLTNCAGDRSNRLQHFIDWNSMATANTCWCSHTWSRSNKTFTSAFCKFHWFSYAPKYSSLQCHCHTLLRVHIRGIHVMFYTLLYAYMLISGVRVMVHLVKYPCQC